MRVIRWNLSSRARQLSGGDAIVVSIPKSGRTWLRTFLSAYFCAKTGQPFLLETPNASGVPRLIYTHDLFEHKTKADLWDRIRGKYLIPESERALRPILLLARDPRDAFVSLFVQLTRRTRETPNEIKTKSVSELLHDPMFGILSMIDVMNAWVNEWAGRSDFLIVRYESLQESPADNFRAVLEFLGESAISGAAFNTAMEFSAFGNMQKLESSGAFAEKILRPGDARDPESYKVRRGKVGGYKDYLSPNEQRFAAEALRKLDPRFGYTV